VRLDNDGRAADVRVVHEDVAAKRPEWVRLSRWDRDRPCRNRRSDCRRFSLRADGIGTCERELLELLEKADDFRLLLVSLQQLAEPPAHDPLCRLPFQPPQLLVHVRLDAAQALADLLDQLGDWLLTGLDLVPAGRLEGRELLRAHRLALGHRNEVHARRREAKYEPRLLRLLFRLVDERLRFLLTLLEDLPPPLVELLAGEGAGEAP